MVSKEEQKEFILKLRSSHNKGCRNAFEYYLKKNDYLNGVITYSELKSFSTKIGYHLPKKIRRKGYKELQFEKLKCKKSLSV